MHNSLPPSTPSCKLSPYIRAFFLFIDSFENLFENLYKKTKKHYVNVIKLRNDGFEGNTKNVLLFFMENLNFFVDIQVEICGLLSFLIIGQLFIGICFWRYL